MEGVAVGLIGVDLAGFRQCGRGFWRLGRRAAERRPEAGFAGGFSGLAPRRFRRRSDERPHALPVVRLDAAEGQRHHDARRQAHAGRHFGLAADGVDLEAVAVVEAGVDALQGAAPGAAPPPASGGRRAGWAGKCAGWPGSSGCVGTAPVCAGPSRRWRSTAPALRRSGRRLRRGKDASARCASHRSRGTPCRASFRWRGSGRRRGPARCGGRCPPGPGSGACASVRPPCGAGRPSPPATACGCRRADGWRGPPGACASTPPGRSPGRR